jgi:hypothetical protein
MASIRDELTDCIIKKYVQDCWVSLEDDLYGWESKYVSPAFAQAASKRSGILLREFIDTLSDKEFSKHVEQFFIQYGRFEM